MAVTDNRTQVHVTANTWLYASAGSMRFIIYRNRYTQGTDRFIYHRPSIISYDTWTRYPLEESLIFKTFWFIFHQIVVSNTLTSVVSRCGYFWILEESM